MRKEFNSHRTGLRHQHDHRFIVLGHQYGRRDVMWKHSIAPACFIFSLSMLMTSINYTLSSFELSNPPKTSPKCIRNLTVHDEALTMCFKKRTLFHLSTDSREKRWVLLLLLLLSPLALQAVACANHSLQSYFFQKEFFDELIVFRNLNMNFTIFFYIILSGFSKLSLSFKTKT